MKKNDMIKRKPTQEERKIMLSAFGNSYLAPLLAGIVYGTIASLNGYLWPAIIGGLIFLIWSIRLWYADRYGDIWSEETIK